MFWVPLILIGGAITYGISSAFAKNKKEEAKKKTVKAEVSAFNYKKSELPSKIRFWDDIKSAEESGKWKSGGMPSEFRHYEKYNDKTKKWERISHTEHDLIWFWDDGKEDGLYYFIPKKPKGKEGQFYINYFTNIPRRNSYLIEKNKKKSKQS